MAPAVSVVVITRDRPADLESALARLSSLPEQPGVVVVDNGSVAPYIPRLRRQFPAVEFVALPANRGAAARTLGVRAAGTEYVAFCDDDSWWAPGALYRAVAVMEGDPRIGLVAARVVVEPRGVDDPNSVEMAAGPLGADLRPADSAARAVMGCLACGAVVRSRAYLSVGGFAPEMGVGGEEQLLVWDLWASGWRAVYLPEVVAHHQPAASRDPSARRATVTRNDLWTAWARLPVKAACARTAAVLVGGRREPVATARGALRALRGAEWALARRCRLPAEVETARRRMGSPPSGSSRPG